ncbi:MAG: sulfur carrier protein ThiS [Phycisphaerales bacterium JB060]
MAQATQTITLDVNGEARSVPEGTTIAGLVEHLGLAKTACAVEVNRKLAPKATHDDHTLADGDHVEIVTLVGGG